MRESVAAYTSRAGEKLRAERLQACHMAVFLQSNPHRPDDLVPEREQPRKLFATRGPATLARVMGALDAVNACYGRGTLRPLATSIARPCKHDVV